MTLSLSFSIKIPSIFGLAEKKSGGTNNLTNAFKEFKNTFGFYYSVMISAFPHWFSDSLNESKF